MSRVEPSRSGTIKAATETRLSWKHIRDVIHGRILNSTYAAGDKLPKDEHLALELGCSRATVQRAMRDLAESGAVERRRKGGTCVRRDPVTRATLDIPITRLEVEQRGAVYSYQFIRKAVTQPPLAVASRLGLQGQAPLLRIEALHLADHRPYIYEDRWICQATVPEIEEIDLKLQSANEWLVRNKPFSRCDIRFFAKKTDARLSEILDAEDQEALFVMERTTWINDDPITSVTAVTHPGYQLLTTI
ncbi:MAG: GntR family transcriptional regulator [Geminicoccales bacterium]